MARPFKDSCPKCGHSFTLADLREMAVGDGFQRHMFVRLPDGTERVVSFDELHPPTMTVIPELSRDTSPSKVDASS
jgi:hypothetical protein